MSNEKDEKEDIFSQLKKIVDEPAETSEREAESDVREEVDEHKGESDSNPSSEFQERSFGSREALSVRAEADAENDILGVEKTSGSQKTFKRVKNIIKPDGHFNKPVIAGIAFIVLFLLFVFLPGGGDKGDELAQTNVKAEKLPPSSSEDLTGVNPGSVADNAGNVNSGESILGGGNINANTSTNVMAGNANTMSNSITGNYNQPVTTTTTKTYTTIEPQNGGMQPTGDQSQQQPSQPTGVARQNVQPQRRQMSEDFTVDFGDGDQSNAAQNNGGQVRNSQPVQSDLPVRQLRVMPGSKIQMVLNEPFRSGIETKVQAISLNNIKGIDGKVIVPSNSVFELTFRPEEISGRVMARNVARVYLSDGSIGEIVGIIKGADGYAGLTGKLTKQNGKSIGGKILGGIARVTAGRIGQLGGVGNDVESEIENTGVTDRDGIYRSSRVVEIAKGTQFYLFVGSPE